LTPTECPAFFDTLDGRKGILAAAGELVAQDEVEVAFDQAQVALNIPPYRHQPGRPHIDGYAPGQQIPGTFTLLAGLLLTDETADNGGNLWVWPGSHLSHGAFFAAHGPQAFAETGGYPDVELQEPAQVQGRRGDVLFAHYLLGHNIGGNYQTDRTRRAVYWRLRARGHASRWADCLADPWLEYRGVREALET
jgi:ectoine hydroxylase-related dioxygenase (phytanoyl-CoA dioxygenase family)